MDGNRLDRLARQWVARSSRRRALAFLGGLHLGGLAMPIGAAADDATPPSLSSDLEPDLSDRVRYTTSYLGRPISFEAPVNFMFTAEPKPENGIRRLKLECSEEDGSRTIMQIYALDMRHLTSLEERVAEHVQAIRNTQAAAVDKNDYLEPKVTFYPAGHPEGIDGRESAQIYSAIPDENQRPKLYVNTICTDENRSWEVSLDSGNALRGGRMKQYKATRSSFRFLDT